MIYIKALTPATPVKKKGIQIKKKGGRRKGKIGARMQKILKLYKHSPQTNQKSPRRIAQPHANTENNGVLRIVSLEAAHPWATSQAAACLQDQDPLSQAVA